jgi:phosphoglycolate phosphatase-like HAD superfamily hydrolase
MIQPVVAIDIDGTLGDYHTHFLSFAEDWLGYDAHAEMPVYDGSEPFSAWCEDAFAISIEVFRLIKLAYRQGGMKRTMPILDGAQKLCWDIQDAGAELWMTTTRPYLSLDNIVPDTVEWLRRYHIEYDGMLFDEDKYAQLAARIHPDRVILVLDDLKEMCEAANELFPGHVMQVANHYNAGAPFTVATDLKSAHEIALDRIANWREQYDDVRV